MRMRDRRGEAHVVFSGSFLWNYMADTTKTLKGEGHRDDPKPKPTEEVVCMEFLFTYAFAVVITVFLLSYVYWPIALGGAVSVIALFVYKLKDRSAKNYKIWLLSAQVLLVGIFIYFFLLVLLFLWIHAMEQGA